jgi:hypothetical protein
MCEPTFRAGNEPVGTISFLKLRCLTAFVPTVTFQLVAHGPAETARMTSGYLTRRQAATGGCVVDCSSNHTALNAQGAN